MGTVNEVIAKDPEVLGGVPVFRGTRVPFQALLDYLEGGQTLTEFLDDFPTVSRDAAISALEQAKLLLVNQLG
jgi:uncharacterized protein (DUF433 family)